MGSEKNTACSRVHPTAADMIAVTFITVFTEKRDTVSLVKRLNIHFETVKILLGFHSTVSVCSVCVHSVCLFFVTLPHTTNYFRTTTFTALPRRDYAALRQQ